MMRTAIYLLALLMSFQGLTAQVKFFQGSWSELIKEAQKTQKPIWVDFYATWCGPCRMMSKNTFEDKAVGDFSNANYIAYKLDAEKGEGPSLADKYEISAYPTIVFFDSNGNMTKKEVGFKNAEQFLASLKSNQSLKGKSTVDTPVEFFSGTWSELLAQAKKTGKPFWVDFYAVWCGPCKMMSSRTFKNPAVGSFSNANYVAYKLDCEKGEGPSLAQKYKITAYPTVIAFDPNGNEINRHVGFLDADRFNEWLKKGWEKVGKRNKGPQGSIQNYQFQDYWKLKEPYYQKLKDEALNSEEQKKRYEQAFALGVKKNDFDYEDLVQKWSSEAKKNDIWKYDVAFYLAAKKYDKLIEILQPRIEAEEPVVTDSEIHWICCEFLKAGYVKPEIIRWLNQSIRNSAAPEKLDTKAALYFLSGKHKEALEYVNLSLKSGKNSAQEESSKILKTLAQQATDALSTK